MISSIRRDIRCLIFALDFMKSSNASGYHDISTTYPSFATSIRVMTQLSARGLYLINFPSLISFRAFFR